MRRRPALFAPRGIDPVTGASIRRLLLIEPEPPLADYFWIAAGARPLTQFKLFFAS
jgi:hypothetical protein